MGYKRFYMKRKTRKEKWGRTKRKGKDVIIIKRGKGKG